MDFFFRAAPSGGNFDFALPSNAVVQFALGTPSTVAPKVGEVVTIPVNGTGPYSVTYKGQALTIDSQTATLVTITWPDLALLGDKTATYGVAYNVVVIDTQDAANDLVSMTTSVSTGNAYGQVTAKNGIYADDGTLNVSDYVYIKYTSGNVIVNVADGTYTPALASTLDYYVFTTVWGLVSNEVIVGEDLPSVLSQPVGVATGATTGSGTISTTESGGILYFHASVNQAESEAAIKASGSQAVAASGLQSVTVSGLQVGTLYYLHYVHTDAGGSDSNVSRSAGFTTGVVETPLVVTAVSPVTGALSVTVTRVSFVCPSAGLSLTGLSDVVLLLEP